MTASFLLAFSTIFNACSANDQIINPEHFWAERANGALVVDVRTTEEYNLGHIINSIHIPYDQLNDYKQLLPNDKNTQILVYCRTGRRSGIAQTALKEMGYLNTHNAGGYDELEAAKDQ